MKLLELEVCLYIPFCSDYNIANFDAIKQPELEVCFYTPRSGGVSAVAQARRLRGKTLTRVASDCPRVASSCQRVASDCHTTNESSISQFVVLDFTQLQHRT